MKPSTKTKTTAQKTREAVMTKFKKGELHTGSVHGPVVTNPKQAVAIGYSEGRKASRNKQTTHRTTHK